MYYIRHYFQNKTNTFTYRRKNNPNIPVLLSSVFIQINPNIGVAQHFSEQITVWNYSKKLIQRTYQVYYRNTTNFCTETQALHRWYIDSGYVELNLKEQKNVIPSIFRLNFSRAIFPLREVSNDWAVQCEQNPRSKIKYFCFFFAKRSL